MEINSLTGAFLKNAPHITVLYILPEGVATDFFRNNQCILSSCHSYIFLNNIIYTGTGKSFLSAIKEKRVHIFERFV